ncbi:MAG: hypothetical protein A2445_03225 [Candidatus Jacksonbacteria bacterium RIFOXYC2_FULL_44_29]|nr:MAG: hypothetical protein A2240_01305 [Candidatus Jacksonbacteria bacterium RIFOXYA2_FULL_43_12]OGY77669.1 MAG: hypothetical protein A2445_03225 [Candidatus Jacksonbacteria bacterium RIFOXYC2_FULL_44_29]OGY79556.1 MAG: hypothetical protein A2550_02310 [Candidatus Jacksonbacteria bacterium RIFOXYD2_FULL_43_21]
MILQKGLISNNQKSLAKTAWYRQRFDACPLFLGLVALPHFFKETRKGLATSFANNVAGGEFTDVLAIYTGKTGDWHINLADIKRIAELFINKCKTQTNISGRLMAKWEVDKEKFYQAGNKVAKINFDNLKLPEIAKVYEQLVDSYHGWLTMSSLIDGFALGTDEFVNRQVRELLTENGVKKGQGEIFAALTAPVVQSFTNEAEISLLKIARQISLLPKLKKIWLRQSPAQIQKRLSRYPVIDKLLKQHQQNYFWLKNNYFNHQILNESDFINEIKQILKSKIDIASRLRESLSQPGKNKRRKNQLLKKFVFSKSVRNLLQISEDFTAWQDERKKTTLLMTHYVGLIARGVAGRTNYTVEELKFFAPEEFGALLRGQGYYPNPKEVKSRLEYCLIYYRLEHYEPVVGNRARLLAQKILGKAEETQVNDFRGMTASPGRVQGTVKILKSVQEVGKIEPGDVLVAVMTRPDYMIAIKKACAVVTDEGGITCHAAIVSRELGIPCIIGTKIATRVLHDGDVVEVNANHGVVTVVERK